MVDTVLAGRYRLEALIARGGLAEVYRAFDIDQQRVCAVKKITSHLHDDAVLPRFRQEAQTMVDLQHPHIISMFDVGEDSGTPFFVMEFADSGQLRTRMYDLALEELLKIIASICDALDYAHQQGIVHRDVKPENIMLSEEADAEIPQNIHLLGKLTDFGLASIHSASSLSVSGTMVGSARYMAPEQAMGGEVDGRADLYALGVILYEIVTGHAPFSGDFVSVVSQHLHAPPVAPHLHSPVDEILEAVILKLLEKTPSRRFASAGEVARILRGLSSMSSESFAENMPEFAKEIDSDVVRRSVPPGGQVALMFTDMVNSTYISYEMGQKNFIANVLLPHNATIRVALRMYNGREVKTIGDAFFAVFDSPIDAVRCAMSIQSRFAHQRIMTNVGDLKVRIGIHTGEPISIGGDFIGTDVDQAARLEDVALGGQILISETTYEEIAPEADIPTHYLGKHKFKGLPDMMRLFEVLWTSHPPTPPLTAESPPSIEFGTKSQTAILLDAITRRKMVGRKDELDILKKNVDAARNEGGRCILLSGPSGIGKTRLASEALVYARLRRCQVFIGRCTEEGDVPYHPFVEALTEALRYSGDSVSPELASELVGLVPAILEVFPEAKPAPSSNPKQAQLRLFDAVRQYLAKLSRNRPLVLFLDDLHWADVQCAALFSYIARSIPSERVLLLGAFRQTAIGREHPLSTFVTTSQPENLCLTVPLDELTHQDVGAMIRVMLEDDNVGDQVISSIYHYTQGNPLFVEEMLKWFVEQGVLSHESSALHTGRWLVKTIDQVELPQSVRVVVEERLAGLDKRNLRTAQWAAVVGPRFDFDVLLEASKMDEGELLDSIDALIDAHLIEEQRVGRQTVYEFDHPLTVQVLYKSLNGPRRARLHHAVGEAIEVVHASRLTEVTEQLARHFFEAGTLSLSLKAFRYNGAAGDKAKRVFANDESVRFYRHALEVLTQLPNDDLTPLDELALRDTLGEVLVWMGDYHGAAIEFEEQLTLAERTEAGALMVAKSMRRLGWLRRRQGNHDDACRQLEKALQALGDIESDDAQGEAATILTELAFLCHRIGEFVQAIQHSKNAFALAEGLGNVSDAAYALGTMGLAAQAQGNFTDAFTHFQNGMERHEKAGDIGGIASTHNNMGNLFMDQSRYVKAEEHYRESLKLREKTGDVLNIAATLNNLGNVAMSRGDYTQAEANFQRCLDVQRLIVNPFGIAIAMTNLGHVALLNGTTEAAVQHFRDALAQAEPTQALDLISHLHTALAEALIRQHDIEGAESHARDALRLAKQLQSKLAEALALRALGALARETRDYEKAHEELTRAALLLEEAGSKHEHARTLVELARLHEVRGDESEGQRFRRKAAALFTEVGADAEAKGVKESDSTSQPENKPFDDLV